MTNILGRKNISELTTDQLEKVYNANEKLQHEVLDDMIESEMNYISEQLDEIRKSLSNWSVGTDSRPFLTVDTSRLNDFIEGLKAMQANYCTLADKDAHIIDELDNTITERNNVEMYSDEFYRLEEVAENKAQKVADMLADHFKDILDSCYSSKYQENYFVDFYAESRLDEDFYIKDDTFTLYKDVSYTKSYN